MSLRSEPISVVPSETDRVARAAFPKGNLYLKMRDELGTFYEDADFTALFSTRGQPAFPPWRLALITLMQFADFAGRGKTSVGWFYGFKLHITVSECGELLAWFITAGNIDDRRPVPGLARKLLGKLFGDQGYISSPLKSLLKEQGVEFLTKLKKNMKP